ncbi:hypothetical protein MGG_02017 [Pyricularia oryzae 70-15]|uniref:Uncharacterized protein n=1 Tax=Pyricularia oryzae (strain 70-15 / ATCC MYA-4617 / FGSC 8958) TaxID=242507 RepID=G4MMS1_PYRO7|nr:uncharacterized protein MGG_02017 [Pyricularia oryzae 70-15]EHA56151.1 hypothetical protein MGG_02017 [Pyricularia oryzae 70-15]
MLTNRGYRFLVLGFERVLRAPCHQQAHQTPHCRTLGVEPWGSGSVFGMPPVPSTPSRAGRHVGDEHDFSPPSAAVAAASKELLDLEFEGLENFFGLNGESNYLPGFQGRPKSPSRNITSTPTIHEEDEGANDDDDGLASDIAAAREASVSFSTKLQKKRIRRRRKPSTREDDDTETETQRRHRRHQHERSKHRDAVDGDSSSDHPRRRQRSRSRSPLAGKRHHRKLRREEHQLVLAEGDEVEYPKSPLSLRSSPALSPRRNNLNISAPMLSREPLPSMLLLKPTVYDLRPSGSSWSPRVAVGSTSPPTPSSRSRSTPGKGGARAAPVDYFDDHGDGLSPVQRNLEQEETHRWLAEDAEARKSALQKAKAAVMS